VHECVHGIGCKSKCACSTPWQAESNDEGGDNVYRSSIAATEEIRHGKK
jgi:hypothetical protein